MPTKNEEDIQLFYEVDGEKKPFEIGEIKFKAEDIESEILSEILEPKEISLSLTESTSDEILKIVNKKIKSDIWKEFKKISCNNWRKMHHLPMVRRRGK